MAATAQRTGTSVVVKAVVPGWQSHPRRVSFPDQDSVSSRRLMRGGFLRLILPSARQYSSTGTLYQTR